MRIDLSTLPTTAPRAPSASAQVAMAQGWAVGQLLSISVIEQLDATTLRLSVNGQPLVAKTALNLPAGTQLTAKVLTAGSQTQLMIQAPPDGESPPAVVNAALGRALPQQAPLAEVVPRMAQQLANPAGLAVLGKEVVNQLDSLLKALPDLRALAQPTALANAVRQAGNGLERRLGEAVLAQDARMKGTTDADASLPTGDLKLKLIALREALLATSRPILPSTTSAAQRPQDAAPSPLALPRAAQSGTALIATVASTAPMLAQASSAIPAASGASEPGPQTPAAPDSDPTPGTQPGSAGLAPPGSLLEDVNAALARITTHQLDTANAAQNQTLLACFELPVKTAHGLQTLNIEVQDEGRPQSTSSAAALAVMVEVPVGDLGKLRARIGLAGQRIAITTWSDTLALRELILAHIGELDSALAARGFDAAPSVLRELAPPRTVHQGGQHLIDTEV